MFQNEDFMGDTLEEIQEFQYKANKDEYDIRINRITSSLFNFDRPVNNEEWAELSKCYILPPPHTHIHTHTHTYTHTHTHTQTHTHTPNIYPRLGCATQASSAQTNMGRAKRVKCHSQFSIIKIQLVVIHQFRQQIRIL